MFFWCGQKASGSPVDILAGRFYRTETQHWWNRGDVLHQWMCCEEVSHQNLSDTPTPPKNTCSNCV